MPDNDSASENGGRSGGESSKALWGIALIVAMILVLISFQVFGGNDPQNVNHAIFVAKRGPLTISVLESGTIKSREQVILKNEVEGETSIISIIPEGTWAKEGDLLLELDASSLEDYRIDQEISVQNNEASYINAKETLAVVENQAESDLDVAKLTLEFAGQDLVQYKEGMFPNDKTSAENDITLREEELVRARETMEWSQKLYDKGFISKSDLQADQLAVTRGENSLELANNNLKLLQEYTYHRQIAQLESDLRQATMALERTKRKAKADVVQARADLNAKELEFKRQQEKLNKLEDQISKTRIHAPVEGMVIYATSARNRGRRDNQEPLAVGVDVRERQELIYLPVASTAMAEVDIHEGSLEKVRAGLPAIITVDALQGRKFVGTVGRIAPLPDPQSMWMNPDLKVYNTDVYLEGEEPTLRTGMSCKVEIIVEQFEDVVYIPIQAVIRVGGQPTVYIVREEFLEERQVEIGLDNNRMVHVISGLNEGEVVLLTPPLKSGTLDPNLPMQDIESPSGASKSMRQRIDEKLKETSRNENTRPGMGSDGLADPPREETIQPVMESANASKNAANEQPGDRQAR